MLDNLRSLLVGLKGIDFLLVLLVGLLETFLLLLCEGLSLGQLFAKVFVLDAGVFFERSPLVLQLVDLLSQAFLVQLESFTKVDGITEFSLEVGQFIVLLVYQVPIFLSKALDHTFMPFLALR